MLESDGLDQARLALAVARRAGYARFSGLITKGENVQGVSPGRPAGIWLSNDLRNVVAPLASWSARYSSSGAGNERLRSVPKSKGELLHGAIERDATSKVSSTNPIPLVHCDVCHYQYNACVTEANFVAFVFRLGVRYLPDATVQAPMNAQSANKVSSPRDAEASTDELMVSQHADPFGRYPTMCAYQVSLVGVHMRVITCSRRMLGIKD